MIRDAAPQRRRFDFMVEVDGSRVDGNGRFRLFGRYRGLHGHEDPSGA
jgi:hypothetical protein